MERGAKGESECHLRISVSLKRLELWGGFGNHPEFSEINAQLFVSGVRVKAVISLESKQVRKYTEDGCKVFFVRDCSFAYSYLRFLFLLAISPLHITK